MGTEKTQCDCTDCNCEEKQSTKTLSKERIDEIGKQFFDLVVGSNTFKMYSDMVKSCLEQLESAEKTREAYDKIMFKILRDKLYITNTLVQNENIGEKIPEILDPVHSQYLLPSLMKMLINIITAQSVDLAKAYESQFPFKLEETFQYNDYISSLDDMISGKYDVIINGNGQVAVMMANGIIDGVGNEVISLLDKMYQHFQITEETLQAGIETVNKKFSEFSIELQKVECVKKALEEFEKENSKGGEQ